MNTVVPSVSQSMPETIFAAATILYSCIPLLSPPSSCPPFFSPLPPFLSSSLLPPPPACRMHKATILLRTRSCLSRPSRLTSLLRASTRQEDGKWSKFLFTKCALPSFHTLFIIFVYSIFLFPLHIFFLLSPLFSSPLLPSPLLSSLLLSSPLLSSPLLSSPLPGSTPC